MEERTTMNIPVIALRGLTVFPDLTLSFDVEREISIYALDSAMEGDRTIFLVTQREIATTAPTEEDLYTVGTVCRILQILKTSETSVRVIVEGQQRARIHRLWQNKPFLQANVELLEEDFPGRMTPRMEALIRQTYVTFGEYKELVPNLTDDFVSAVLDCRDPGRLADFIAQNINLRHGDRQRILEELNPTKRLRLLNEILAHEVEVISLEVELEQKVRSRVAQVQKDMILREQMKVLKHELGDDGDEEIEEYTEKIEKLKLPEEIHSKLIKEVDRLAKPPYATIWTCVWKCRGTRPPRIGPTWRRPVPFWIRNTLVWIRSRSVFWSSSLCSRSTPMPRGRFCVWWALPALARPPSPFPLPRP